MHSAVAQTQAGRNLIRNGGFESVRSDDNLWDGVDASGRLSVHTYSPMLVQESGNVGRSAVPPSVAFHDLNGDGRGDIVAADAIGYIHVYFNKGSDKDPKFTHSEILNLFTAAADNYLEGDGGGTGWGVRRCQRIFLSPLTGRNALDLVLGNYFGEVQMFPASGSGNKPDFRMPRDPSTTVVETYSGGRLWGNLFAPAMHDFDGDGKKDMILGEGSYSANSIHLLVNQGSDASPKFNENNRYFLVYGMGREQLAPTLIDANGDGFMDIVMADRRGEVTLHLHPGKSWKPGDDFPETAKLKFGNSSRLGSAVTPFAADYNGDGKFDLLMGRINGRVSVALNTGTNAEPAFSPPSDIPGQNQEPARFRRPIGWGENDNLMQGNAYAYISAYSMGEPLAEKDPPEGKNALKFGYVPYKNEVLEPYDFEYEREEFTGNSRYFRIQMENLPLLHGRKYELSFKIMGNKARNVQWRSTISGLVKLGPDKITRGERNSVTIERNQKREEIELEDSISVSSNWSTVTGTIDTGKFRDRDIRGQKGRVQGANLTIECELPYFDSFLVIDDVKLVE